jgi:hypothetical protein
MGQWEIYELLKCADKPLDINDLLCLLNQKFRTKLRAASVCRSMKGLINLHWVNCIRNGMRFYYFVADESKRNFSVAITQSRFGVWNMIAFKYYFYDGFHYEARVAQVYDGRKWVLADVFGFDDEDCLETYIKKEDRIK